MKANTKTVLAWIGLSEGGYVNHPKDPGGATDRGITQSTYDAWNQRRGVKKRSVRGISKEEADQIIVSQYFVPVRFDQLPPGLDYAVADFAVNSGPRRAVLELQKLLPGIARDGVMGNKTLAAVEAANLQHLIAAYGDARMAYLRGLKTWGTFGGGWTRRVVGNVPGIQTSDIGVIDRASKLAASGALAVSEIPAPRPPREDLPTGKATDSDIAESTWLQKAMQDPASWIPAAGAIVTPMLSGTGPIQWAVAGVIIVGAFYAVARGLRRVT